jgi:superfamily II DNA/RNA helicase
MDLLVFIILLQGSDMDEAKRRALIDEFRSGTLRALVTSDTLSKMNQDHVSFVIHFDMAADREIYTTRFVVASNSVDIVSFSIS